MVTPLVSSEGSTRTCTKEEGLDMHATDMHDTFMHEGRIGNARTCMIKVDMVQQYRLQVTNSEDCSQQHLAVGERLQSE